MKNLKTKSCFLLGLIVLMGCEKNDNNIVEQQVQLVTAAAEPLPQVRVFNTMGKYFVALDTICAPYLKYTTKYDISKLPNETFVDSLDDGKLKLIFDLGDSAPRKFDPTTTEWWGNWNVSPYVETNDPHVLRMADWSTVTITLSKKCYIFGFELSARLNLNNNNPVEFGAGYFDSDRLPDDTPIGRVGQKVKSPGGARLFAIKSEVPFNTVVIYWDGAGSAQFTRDYAIANIRYVTSKKIFEQHRN